eukprot:COSAG04_NODE_175_length_21521_cov_167.404071_11_plen_48_part_00
MPKEQKLPDLPGAEAKQAPAPAPAPQPEQVRISQFIRMINEPSNSFE